MFVFEKLRKISTSFGYYTWSIEGETFRRRWGLGIWKLRKMSTSFGYYTWSIEGETFRRRWGLGIWRL